MIASAVGPLKTHDLQKQFPQARSPPTDLPDRPTSLVSPCSRGQTGVIDKSVPKAI